MRVTLTSPQPFLKLLIGSVRVPRPPSKDILLIRNRQDTLVGLDTLVGKDIVYLDTGCFSPVPSQLRVSWRMLSKAVRDVAAMPPGEAASLAKLMESNLTIHELDGKPADARIRQSWCRFWALCGRAFGPLLMNEC